jgi:propanol-preferring alcohol dehydrogenase
VAVVGFGGLGHLAVQYARAVGGRVLVLTHRADADRAAMALALGAEGVVDTSREAPAEALRAWEGGADVALMTAPSTPAAAEAVPGLAPDGTLVVLGVGAGSITLRPLDLILGRRRVVGSPTGSRHDVREALDFAARHGVRPHLTRFALAEADQALTRLASGQLKGRAVLVP